MKIVVFLALMLGGLLGSVSMGALGAAELPPPRPPAPPNPVLSPDPPLLGSGAELSTEDMIAKRLRELLAHHDRRIVELLEKLDGRSPGSPDNLPGIEAAQRDRDAALARAATQAQDFVARRRSTATVASAIAPGSTSASDSLRALNRLAVADCYRRLIIAADTEATATTDRNYASELQAGVAALATVDAALLAENDLPTLFYLRAWFAAERARRLPPGAAATAAADESREAARLLLRDFPHSTLARTAQDLIRQLPGEGS